LCESSAIVTAIDAFAEPLKLAEPVASPDNAIVRAVDKVVAVVLFPVTLPVTLPVIVPAMKLPLASRFTSVDAVFAFVPAVAKATALFITVCVPVIAPDTAGRVFFKTDLSKRMWLSPSPTLSEDVGLVVTKPSMYVDVSSAIISSSISLTCQHL
jgi:hypothetical protein